MQKSKSYAKLTRIKPGSETWQSCYYQGDKVLANKEELLALLGKYNLHHDTGRYEETQFAWGITIELEGKPHPVIIYDYQTYFKLDNQTIEWRINACSKGTSKRVKILLNDYLYKLRRNKL